MRLTVLASLLLLLTACPTEVDNEHENVGFACLLGEPDTAYEVTVDFEQCLSSSCDELVGSSCMVTIDGTTISIEAFATIRSKTGQTACTADCGAARATCQTPPLPAGTYTVQYAGDTVELVVPTATQTCTKENAGI
jgi:hypothetical protein